MVGKRMLISRCNEISYKHNEIIKQKCQILHDINKQCLEERGENYLAYKAYSKAKATQR